MMEILKMKPAFKDYIWGGEKLRDKYGKITDITPVAESWELSCHPDGLSIISCGKYAGMTISEYIKNNPSSLGTKNKTGELPILIKLIDAADNLSVQVHPNDEQAKAWENQNGKTEMWYVVEADDDAKITFGLKEDTPEEKLRNAIKNNTLEELLNSVPSKKGDVFFVESGTIHAIGKGNLIAEIQQNSNVTYRLYDYGRKDKNGNLRELHIDKGVKASRTTKMPTKRIPACSDGTRLIGSCDYFHVKELKLNGEFELCANENSYHALMVVSGNAVLFTEENNVNIKNGETVFVPAGFGKYTLNGNAVVLITQNQPDMYVGIDLGGTNIAAAVVDEYGCIYGRSTCKTNVPRPYNEIFDDMAECAKMAAEDSGISFDAIKSVGVGCPGSLDKNNGIIEFSNNLGFYDVAITDYLEKSLNKKVYIENDANTAAWGEYVSGNGIGYNSMIMITLGTGVGSGIIENGRLLCGAYGKAAEFGHVSLVLGGEKCTCGRSGCFEAYASATALIKQTKEAMKQNPDSKLWDVCGKKLSNVAGITAFIANDDVAQKVVKQYLDYLSEGIINIVNMLQPEIICIGGGISNQGERLLKPIRDAIQKRSFARHGKQQTEVEIAKLANDAGIIGAALLWKANNRE